MLKANMGRLLEVIKAFYTITNIKIAVYSADFEEIAAYPQEQQGLCAMMYCCEKTRKQCFLATTDLFKQCKEGEPGVTVSHKCHAGLTEVAAPLIDNNQIIGYVIFGQITDVEDNGRFAEDVQRRCREYGLETTVLLEEIQKVRYASKEQVQAISFVLNMFATYITTNRLAYSAQPPLVYEVMNYISNNLSGNLSVSCICKYFSVSRSGLYKITQAYMPEGIAEYIKATRLKKAKELLKETDKPIWKIAEETGFRDYNYFLRCFKNTTGVSAGKYRNEFGAE